MKIRLNSGFVNGSEKRRPLLAALLLFVITLGSTAEAIHSHGSLITASGLNISSTGGSRSSTTKPLSENDCTICQLQRNLGASLVSSSLWSIVKEKTSLAPAIGSVVYLSAHLSAPRGRGPPVSI
jgi:hypothetical protein